MIVYMFHITLLTFVEVLYIWISSWVLDIQGYLITINMLYEQDVVEAYLVSVFVSFSLHKCKR